jgi:hypothetical protein
MMSVSYRPFFFFLPRELMPAMVTMEEGLFLELEPSRYLELWMLLRRLGAMVRMNWRTVGMEAQMIRRLASIELGKISASVITVRRGCLHPVVDGASDPSGVGLLDLRDQQDKTYKGRNDGSGRCVSH